jgi:chromosome segregation ATPase
VTRLRPLRYRSVWPGNTHAVNPLLFAPALIKRALDDLSAIAHAARQVGGIQVALVGRLDGLSTQLERFRQDVEPLGQLSTMRAHLEAVRGAVEPLADKLDVLRTEIRPIQELSAVRAQINALRAAIEPLGGKLDELRDDVEPIQHLAQVRAGIEPLDDDMRQVRESIDTIEPLVKSIGSLIDSIDGTLSQMSGDLAPVGDLAEKMPGVKRR